MFEREWYLQNYLDVAASGIDPILHYVLYGAKERRDPSPSFSTYGYLLRNPDVAAAGANPFAHFLRYGTSEGRASGSVTNAAPTAAAGPPAQQIWFNIDEPEIAGDAAIFPIKGVLTVAGWALSKDGIAEVRCEVDGLNVGLSSRRTKREDVAKAFPHHRDTALFSGFEFTLPASTLAVGRHQVAIRFNGAAGLERTSAFSINVIGAAEQPDAWRLHERVSHTERMFTQSLIERFAIHPSFYIWVNCRSAAVKLLPATLRSIASQTYESWHVVVTGDSKARAAVERTVGKEMPDLAARVRCFPDVGEAEELIAQAQPGDLVLPLDAGDLLSADALFEFAESANCDRTADFFYADERRPNVATGHVEPFLKPDWSPALLLATDYVGRPWCATVALLRATLRPLFRQGRLENFDLVLECTERASQVLHVRKVLAQRGEYNVETSEAQARALKRAFERRSLDWSVSPGRIAHTFRCRARAKPDNLVSIIIPTCAADGLIRTCIKGLRTATSYKNIEIIVVDNIRDESSEWKSWVRANADVVVEIKEPFNWSRFNNLAASKASGSYLLFLNDDTEVIQSDWLEALLEPFGCKDVAITGPQLLYPDRRVQHAGIFLADPSLGRHSFRFNAEDDPGYFGLALTQREVIAVTGACLLVRTDVFRQLGGFEEAHAIINNDLDFCLRVHARGLRCIYTPFAQLMHHEKMSRQDMHDEYQEEAFTRSWGKLGRKGDPFFHPDLDPTKDKYQVNLEPVERIFSVRPVYDANSIHRILAVKLDHIGDFVTAFPAFRRLKQAFPAAELIALVAPASMQLARLEPAIDRAIPFQFFHERSQLAHAIDEDSSQKLAGELASLRFDLAVDLRRDPETRNVLKFAGAAVTAGFDYRDEFPWLDIALPFEGNKRLVHKRRHTADDLLGLIETIVAAGSPDTALISRSLDSARLQQRIVARLAEAEFYKGRVICVHPGAGNETKQWPPAYFADLINQLLATEDVNIALIGGPDEKPIGQAVMERVEQRERMRNLIGALDLDELPCFIDRCALFVGNDSGPKHLASGLGVPTVAIHSGVVDAREWGPLGACAVALQRHMICSPCYKSTREECHRGLACLEGLAVSHVLSACRQMLRLDRDCQRGAERERAQA
jgi:ADP-heptose:LPS heptosyltransferase/GT2 family glycosyltransferase